jgi:hypothetical protein
VAYELAYELANSRLHLDNLVVVIENQCTKTYQVKLSVKHNNFDAWKTANIKNSIRSYVLVFLSTFVLLANMYIF